MQIVIVPDTNVFIEYENIITSLVNDVHPFNIDIFILNIVLDEIDKAKLKTTKAQSANILIQNISKRPMILIEGNIKKNGMEIMLDYGNLDQCRTNDDKILKIVSCLNHSVLLTADRNMYLKAKSNNIKSVFVKDKTYIDIKLEILMSQTESEPMEIIVEPTEISYEKFVCKELKQTIEQILINNLGPGYKISFEKDLQDADLCELLKLCVDNFVYFDGYLHKKSKKIISNILKSFKTESDNEKIKILLQKLLILFKIQKEI